MWTEGRTDTSKLIVAFHNSAKAPKIFVSKHSMSFGTSRELKYLNLFGE
jgi:hypothetical protein